MLTIKNLSFSYDNETPVLRNISLHFDTRATAIIGQNGAGKTTLVKLIKGLLKPQPDSGGIHMAEINHASATAAQLAKHIGLVFQNPYDQIFKRTVLDEVMFGPLNLKMPHETALQNCLKALEIVGLKKFDTVNPYDLSLSDMKLVCIASVLAMETRIIILDEPTIAQDQAGRRRIGEIVEMLKRESKLVITIVHDMDFVAEHFERTVLMQNGQILLDGETADVFRDEALLRGAYVDTPYITQLGRRLSLPDIVLNEDAFVEIYSNITNQA